MNTEKVPAILDKFNAVIGAPLVNQPNVRRYYPPITSVHIQNNAIARSTPFVNNAKKKNENENLHKEVDKMKEKLISKKIIHFEKKNQRQY